RGYRKKPASTDTPTDTPVVRRAGRMPHVPFRFRGHRSKQIGQSRAHMASTRLVLPALLIAPAHFMTVNAWVALVQDSRRVTGNPDAQASGLRARMLRLAARRESRPPRS